MNLDQLQEYIKYGLNALQQRKAALAEQANNTTNPLNRLCLIERMNEIDIVIKYFSDYDKLQSTNE